MNDLYERFGQPDRKNELFLKEHYDRIMEAGISGYCLVTITLKNFLEFSHIIGETERDKMIRICFDRLASCLREDEYIVRVHSWYYNLLIKCRAEEADLHPRAAEFHFAVRDTIDEIYGRKLYLKMGFYPMIKPEVDFYCAQYYADLCRIENQNYLESTYEMYYVSLVDQKDEFLKLEKLVPEALAHGDFKLYLQPKVNLKTGKVTSAEALMRWIDPKRGMIPLSSFLPNLEQNGFIRDVDLYLFDKACSYMDKWQNEYDRRISVSFNLSKAYYSGAYFMPEYTEVFEKYNISKDLVQIEFLESIILNEADTLKAMVDSIYNYGFTCALDDFGSGFSSFDVLANVSLTALKIDRSLFQNSDNPKEQLLIKHIIDIAHDLNMVTVAEGVESEAYDKYLKEVGCDYIQGFLYYKPMPVEEFEERFIKNKERF